MTKLNRNHTILLFYKQHYSSTATGPCLKLAFGITVFNEQNAPTPEE